MLLVEICTCNAAVKLAKVFGESVPHWNLFVVIRPIYCS